MNESSGVARVSPSEIDTVTMPVFDVRARPGKKQIRGALRYDANTLLSEERLALPVPHDSRVVVYADDEPLAIEVAQRLRSQGYTNAGVLDGGFEAYSQAGLPTEEITQEQPVPGSEAGIPRI